VVNGISLNAAPGGVTLAVEWLAYGLDRASATNPDLSALTPPLSIPLQFEQLELRLAPYSASTALDSGDAVSVNQFSVALDNALSARQTEASGLYIGEPKRGDFPGITGALRLPRYEADTLAGWAAAKTALMLSAVFTGPEIAATGEYFQVGIYLPTITLLEADLSTSGPEQHEPSFTFEATTPSAAAAGMPVVQDAPAPLIVQVTDSDANHPLYSA
jgi:hypothetical protein